MRVFILIGLFFLLIIILTSCEEEVVEEAEDLRQSKSGKYAGLSKATAPGVGFKLDEIHREGEADKLFKMFLEDVYEKEILTNNIFIVSDILEHIPYNKVKEELNNIDENMYNYYILIMLSSQLNRDYFIFIDEPDLRYEFTDISNDPNRKNSIWKTKYGNIEFRINPKYVRS